MGIIYARRGKYRDGQDRGNYFGRQTMGKIRGQLDGAILGQPTMGGTLGKTG